MLIGNPLKKKKKHRLREKGEKILRKFNRVWGGGARLMEGRKGPRRKRKREKKVSGGGY